ncbi:MAG: cob(I)yrinic acid a,c-diamide adenosyltransferase [Planctomycetaceae bacterium]|jgi:cob(I)alamin adenosyltransferase|nr:cob(I)yrinic acid a,c-diamide adenosyltransferase [Planctomycetaceae bacterium]
MGKFQIYTRGGDTGETSLLGGIRVAKNNPRIEVIGEIDELSAVLGVVRSVCSEQNFCPIIHRIQNDLIRFMSELAAPDNNSCKISQKDIDCLESDIDEVSLALSVLTEFVVAGNSRQSAFLHLARTVCRRAERRLVFLSQIEIGVSSFLLVYLNRLSDLLFVLSRKCESN